jgi:hypothetical protein
MRATFSNKLSLAEPGQTDMIRFRHPYRVNVDVFVKQYDRNGRDWELVFSPANVSLPEKIRSSLMAEFISYIRRRAKKRVDTLLYHDFLDMAQSVNIQ